MAESLEFLQKSKNEANSDTDDDDYDEYCDNFMYFVRKISKSEQNIIQFYFQF